MKTKEEQSKYMKEYWAKNKDYLKIKNRASQKKWRDKNKEKLKEYQREWRNKNIDEVRRKDNERNKNPHDRERRRLNQIAFRKRNPKYASAYSMAYYFKNQKAVDETHAKWRKVAEERWGSLYKRYNLKERGYISTVLERAFGLKGNYENQSIKKIKEDIETLKNEINRLKNTYLIKN